MTTVIESPRNPRVKEWSRLHARKGRAETGLFLAEGPHLVEEALRHAPESVAEILLVEGCRLPSGVSLPKGMRATILSERAMAAACEADTPQEVAAVCRIPSGAVDVARGGAFLLLDGVQDPGNVGALIRTADAAGCVGVVCGDGCADPWGPKAVRATQGSLFHVAVASEDLASAIARLKAAGVRVVAAEKGGRDLSAFAPSRDVALVMGGEGAGVSPAVRALCDDAVGIALRGKAESLNVAVAAGVLLFAMVKAEG